MTSRITFPLLPLLIWVGTACSSDRFLEAPLRWSEQDAVSRTLLPMAFDTLWQIGGDADTTLLHPLLLSGGPEGVTVWDNGRKSIVRITPTGSLAWSFGRDGEGPGEFRSVRSVVHLSDGGVAAADDRNGKITILGADGQLRNETREIAGTPFSVAELPSDGFVVLTDAERPFAFLGRGRGILGVIELSLGGIRRASTNRQRGQSYGDRRRVGVWLHSRKRLVAVRHGW